MQALGDLSARRFAWSEVEAGQPGLIPIGERLMRVMS